MILRKIAVAGFRSVRDAQVLHIDQFVTILIGANDHGKTNLLAAISALNDSSDITESDCNWDVDESKQEEFPIISWTFELTSAEREELLAKAKDLRAKAEQAKREREEEIRRAEEEARDEVSDEASDEEEEEPPPAPKTATAAVAASKARPAVVDDDDDDEEEPAGEEDDPDDYDEPEITDATLKTIEQLSKFDFSRTGVGGDVIVELPGGLDNFQFILDFLLERRPRVEVFQGNAKITDSVTLAELEKPENEFMRGIFRQAQIWGDRAKLFTINAKTSRRLNDASKLLTQRIRAEWQQGKDLIFHLKHAGNEGDKILLSIEDPSVAARFVNPTQRSTGFSAFFGMSMALFARKEASPANNYIFVFDEPATALHPHGQVNVQRVFETLARKNQITFTTHSVFMVNKNYPTRNRVVTKMPSGTLIDHKPYLGNWKAVRSNLGLMFTNNFFVADTTLLVEGPSDVIYVSSLLRTCDRLGVIDADLNLFSTLDAGNTADMVAMAKIAADEGRRVVVMVDGDTGASLKKKIDALNASLPTEAAQIDLYILPKNKSIEDRVVYPAVLKQALLAAAEELVNSNIRKYKVGVTADSIKKSLDDDLTEHKDVTFGRAIMEVTKSWFDEPEPLSKLQIARHYDDLVEAMGPALEHPKKPDLEKSKEVAIELHKRLGLQQKLAEETITA